MDERIHTSNQALFSLRHHAEGFAFPPKSPVSSLYAGKWRSQFKGRGLDFQEIRHYRHGDDIRMMDWKVTNRTRKPHVRVYSEEKDRNVIFIVDQRQSMFFGSQEKMKSVIAAESCALGAWRSLKQENRSGFIFFNDEEVQVLASKRGEAHLSHAIKQLSEMNQTLQALSPSGHKPNKEKFHTALKSAKTMSAKDALIVIISDLDTWNHAIEQQVKLLRRDNECIVICISDQLENSLADVSELVVSDGEHQFEVNSRKQNLIQTYANNHQQNLKRISRFLAKFGIPLLPLNTHEDTQKQLIKALGPNLSRRSL